MKRIVVELAFAFIAWLIPFVMSVCIFPLRDAQRPLFEIIMSVTLTANTALIGLAYLRRTSSNRLARSIAIGVTWMMANWAIDLLMFSTGPMQMPLRQYVSEIASAYLVIPGITIALGAAASLSTPRQLSASG
jgi:hypothetical protein